MNINFRIIDKVNIRNTSKLLFVLISDNREGIVVFFYLFDWFKGLLIISYRNNYFSHNNNKNFTSTNLIINPISI